MTELETKEIELSEGECYRTSSTYETLTEEYAKLISSFSGGINYSVSTGSTSGGITRIGY